MITPEWNVFPGNAITLITGAVEGIDSDLKVVNRPLRSSDPNQSVGVFPVLWRPNEASLEIGHRYPSEPTLQTYQIGIQGFVKHGDKDVALATSTSLARSLRMTLYRSDPLRLALQALSADDGISQERYRRTVIKSQQYMNNEVKAQFAFLSVLDVSIETETT